MIKRLESSSNRKVTYSKRISGILKKAKELSILCDIDIVLLMFSPTRRPTAFHGDHRCIGDVIFKFSQLTPQGRTKREMEYIAIASLPVYSSFFECRNQEDQNCNLEQQLHRLREGGNVLSELNGNSCSSLQLREEYSHATKIGIQDEKKLEPVSS